MNLLMRFSVGIDGGQDYKIAHRQDRFPSIRKKERRNRLASKGKPMMAQYDVSKEQYRDAILLFQVGGFYQMYYYDAIVASKALNIKLVSRAIGDGIKIPMCGIPEKTAEQYAERLIQQGYRVVFCQQMEDEKTEIGLTRRQVTKVLEPSTEPIALAEKWDEYLKTHTFEKADFKKKPAANKILAELNQLDLDRITPMIALSLLHEWKEKYGGSNDGV